MTGKTDYELLELAAKAAGIEIDSWIHQGDKILYGVIDENSQGRDEWNPLEDDGDSMRLAVDLDLPFRRAFNGTFETGNDKSGYPIWEKRDPCPYAAARRAIVRAAAAIGEKMP